MGKLKVDSDRWFIRCEPVIMESGTKVFKFYRDNTVRNLFERIIFEGEVY